MYTANVKLESTQYLRFANTSNMTMQNLNNENSTKITLSSKILSYENLTRDSLKRIPSLLSTISNTKALSYITTLFNKSFSFGFFYLQGFAFILFIDACLTDDEPLWEPVEWSLVQTWILFIFAFA
jgi:hypothetical protein